MSLHDFAQLRKRAIRHCSAQHQTFSCLYRTTKLNLQSFSFRMKHTHPRLYQRLLSYAACPRQISGAELHAFVTGESSGRCIECQGPTKFDASKRRYREFCSQLCVRHSKELSARREATWLDKYGTTSPLKNKAVWHKKVQTCRKRYGHDVPSQNKAVSSKIGHSVSLAYQDPSVLEKRRDTCMKKYGVPNTSLVLSIARQRVETNKRTNLEKYGVEHLMQLPAYAEKHKRRSYRTKTFYSEKNSQVLRCQGAEPTVLKQLERNPSVARFTTDLRTMPRIEYEWKGNRRYFPDIVLKTTAGRKALVEVKVPYTLKADLARNKAKIQGTLAAGYDLYLSLVVDSEIIWYKNPNSRTLDKICSQYS